MPYGILTAIMLQVTTPSRYLPVFLSKIETEELQHLFQLLDRVVSTGLSRELNVPFTGLDILNSEDVTESSLPQAQSIAGAALQTVRSLFQISQSLPSFGYVVLSIFGSSSVQTFGNSVGELFSFLGNRVSGLHFTSICGWYSFNHLSFQMRRCCRIYNLSVSEYFIKIGTNI